MRAQKPTVLTKKIENNKEHSVNFEILHRIYKASLKFLTPLNTENTYSTIVEEAVKLAGATYGHIVLKEEEGFKKVFASLPVSFKSKVQEKGFVYKTFVTGKPMIIEIKKTIKNHPELKEMGIKSTILIPLTNKNNAVGVLTLNSTQEHRFGEEELNVLTLFGAMASLAIRKAQLYDETTRALEHRDLFISMASHELKTPLTTISGYTQLLKSRLSEMGPQEAKWVEELSWEVLRLTYLIGDLLEINKIKKGKINYVLKECSLNQVIGRALMDFRFSNPNRKVIFNSKVSEENDRVIGDFDKLLQATLNLLENAAKFSPPSKKVRVSLSYSKPYFSISIRDYGKGIPKDELSKIFEGYYRGSNHTTEGMGLGLYLVKEIIERHRGDITVYSKQDKGTTFNITLRRAKI